MNGHNRDLSRVHIGMEMMKLRVMCFVLGQKFSVTDISNAPLLSSKTQQETFGIEPGTSSPRALISFKRFMMGMISRSAVLSAMNSLSLDERVVTVCSLDAQNKGHPAKMATYPVRERAVSGSRLGSPSGSQLSMKSAST